MYPISCNINSSLKILHKTNRGVFSYSSVLMTSRSVLQKLITVKKNLFTSIIRELLTCNDEQFLFLSVFL